jgi:hypothetical protein
VTLSIAAYAPQFGIFGGHTGIGPPSGAGTLGTEAYANVPTRPTNSSNALSERFIVFLSLGTAEAYLGRHLAPAGTNYTQLCKHLIP